MLTNLKATNIYIVRKGENFNTSCHDGDDIFWVTEREEPEFFSKDFEECKKYIVNTYPKSCWNPKEEAIKKMKKDQCSWKSAKEMNELCGTTFFYISTAIAVYENE